MKLTTNHYHACEQQCNQAFNVTVHMLEQVSNQTILRQVCEQAVKVAIIDVYGVFPQEATLPDSLSGPIKGGC